MGKICSMHNLSEFETIVCELKECSYALRILTHLNDKDVKGYENEWVRLVSDVSELIEQHVHSVDILFDCLSREVDMNSD